jgi:hypothetical protein
VCALGLFGPNLAGMVRYSPEIADEILERLAQGQPLRKICEDLHMPAASSVIGWVNRDESGFAERYVRAREVGYVLLADELIHIADTPMIGTKSVSKATGLEITEGDMIEHRRLQVDTRKWMLAKMLPKVYGDKQQVELTGQVDVVSSMLQARRRSGKAA